MKGIYSIIKSNLKFIDSFGRQYAFEEKDSQIFKTITGGIFTLLITLTVMIIGFLFGKEIFERKTPTSFVKDETVTPEESSINMNDIPMMLAFTTITGAPLQDINRIFQFSSRRTCIDSKGLVNTTLYQNLTTTCNSTKFGVHEEYVNKTVEDHKVNGHNLICLNFRDDLMFRNSFGASDSCFINYRVQLCDPSVESNNCHPDLENISTFITATVKTLSSYVNPSNYEEPIVFYDETYTQQLGNKFFKRSFFRFTNNVIDSDIGWLIENKDIKKYTSLKNVKDDINPITDRLLYVITLESPLLRARVLRFYIKIQELIAILGGLFNGLYIIVSILLYSYVKFKYYLEIVSYLIPEEDINLNLSKSKNMVIATTQSEKINNFTKPEPVKLKSIKKLPNLMSTPKIKRKLSENINFSIDMNFFAYLFSLIFSNCISKYGRRLNEYTKPLEYSKTLISYKNYVRLSYGKSAEIWMNESKDENS